ncbi:unnamed protein product [Caretta caretta]
MCPSVGRASFSRCWTSLPYGFIFGLSAVAVDSGLSGCSGTGLLGKPRTLNRTATRVLHLIQLLTAASVCCRELSFHKESTAFHQAQVT